MTSEKTNNEVKKKCSPLISLIRGWYPKNMKKWRRKNKNQEEKC